MSRSGLPGSAADHAGRIADGVQRWVRSHTGTVGAVVLGLGIVYIILAVVPRLNSQAETRADAWLRELHPAAVHMDSLAIVADLRTPAPEIRRLGTQFDVIQRRRKVHGEVAVYFYARYYMALTIASVAGLLAAAMLVHITRVGWVQAHRYVRITFGVAAATAAFFGAFPTMFRQPENIADNAALYLSYANLENEVLSYLATGEDRTGQPLPPKDFVHALDRRLAELNQIPIGFDASRIPTSSEAFKAVP